MISSDAFKNVLPDAGEIALLRGPSGSGKSRLLKLLRAQLDPARTIDLDSIQPPPRPVVDLFGELSLEQTLEHLSRFGLAEAWTYLREPRELSAGQHWRLRFALAVHRIGRMDESQEAITLISDEFTSLLDRITALIVARALRKSIHPPLRAILATSHDDLSPALRPDITVACDFAAASLLRAMK